MKLAKNFSMFVLMNKIKTIRSPLRYPGGKSRAIKSIAPLIPEFKAYREPFVGGGSVFFYIKQTYPDRSYWINDLYEQLFYFWEQSRLDIDSLVTQVLEWRNNFKEGKVLHRVFDT